MNFIFSPFIYALILIPIMGIITGSVLSLVTRNSTYLIHFTTISMVILFGVFISLYNLGHIQLFLYVRFLILPILVISFIISIIDIFLENRE